MVFITQNAPGLDRCRYKRPPHQPDPTVCLRASHTVAHPAAVCVIVGRAQARLCFFRV